MSRLRSSETEFRRPTDMAEGAVVSVFRVPPEVAGQRVDLFVRSQLHRTSRTRAQHIVRTCAYDASGRKLGPSDRVRSEQRILLWRPAWDEVPAPVDMPVLYEDEHLLAINKPALLPVHPTARYHRNTVIKALQAARPDCRSLSLGHRLDRETSGVLLVSKTRACDRSFKKQLERREGVRKTYVAITWGMPRGGHAFAAFRYERAVELDTANPLRVKMRISDRASALAATTLIETQHVRYSQAGRSYSWVRCGLETGRQHQIRVHLASLGAPVVGDKLYGPDERAFARAADGSLTAEDLEMLEMGRHALHAARIELAHPATGLPLVVDAPIPADMAEFWASLTIRAELCPSQSDRAPRE
jgi:RluA family pseudouridine synthase